VYWQVLPGNSFFDGDTDLLALFALYMKCTWHETKHSSNTISSKCRVIASELKKIEVYFKTISNGRFCQTWPWKTCKKNDI